MKLVYLIPKGSLPASVDETRGSS